MEIIQNVLISLGGTAIAVSALAWLSRSLLVHWLSKDIEHHKSQLDSQNAVELERLRAMYAQQTIEHDVRYRRVDERVGKHLEEIYLKLHEALDATSSYIKVVAFSDEPSSEDKLARVGEATKELWDCIIMNRIYVPPKLYERWRRMASRADSSFF